MAASEISSDAINGLTSTFFNFGPFFLAIFAQVYIISKARAWYAEASTRTQPPVTSEERETYRYYFLGSIGVSIVLFGIAIWAWWALNIVSDHQYRFEIDGLRAEQSVDDPKYYSQDVQYPLRSGTYYHDTKFIVVDDRPIRQGDAFTIHYNINPAAAGQGTTGPLGTGSLTADLVVRYAGHREDRFHVTPDGNGHPTLVASSGGPTGADGERRLASLQPATSPHIQGAPAR